MSSSENFYHYLPVDDLAMRWGSYLTGVGRGVIPPGKSYPPREHPSLYDFEWGRGRTLPEFQLILITGGQGVFESRQTGIVPFQSASLLVLFPGVWHRYRPDPKTGWLERWFGFNGEIAHRLIRLRLLCPENAVRKVAHVERLEASFDRLLNQIHAHPAENSVLLSMYFMTVLADTIGLVAEKSAFSDAKVESAADGVEDDLVARAVQLIWTQSHRDLSVTRIAQKLAVTRRTIQRRFQAATGRTLIEEITCCRLSRAKRLLSETDLAVKAVAHQSGFPSEAQMRVVFQQQEKSLPSEYRRHVLHRAKSRRQPRTSRNPLSSSMMRRASPCR